MKNISTLCPKYGHTFKAKTVTGGANPTILAFFTPERLTILTGSPNIPDARFLCQYSPKIVGNSTLDELDVESVGKAKYAHIIGLLILSIRPK